MSNLAIHLSVKAEPSPAAVELLGPESVATIEFFDSFQPSMSSRVSMNALDGLSPRELGVAQSTGVGEFRCTSQACVSDTSLFESSAAIANVDPGLLANSQVADIMEPMNNQASFESLNSELTSALPRIQHALSGELDFAELSQLIADIQSQVLDLSSLSRDLFGDVSNDAHEIASQLSTLDTESIIASMQIDSASFAQPALAMDPTSLAHYATLDGLFTSPEAFPLTMDFSSSSSVQEASELFASTGSASSISSTASSSETDSGLVGKDTPGSTD
ncbi:hypothetical protein [Limnobacter parvus]|uniref:Uncharacterized protein n=1 Tax=Limnobacter parvus TaxID=2939690 RepID=A0ABT1XJN8_9BURK|nr:hypothetical protein [Limnobacter parvus]MCR2747503.1 hypothetical protein [Limnobacter parvus]